MLTNLKGKVNYWTCLPSDNEHCILHNEIFLVSFLALIKIEIGNSNSVKTYEKLMLKNLFQTHCSRLIVRHKKSIKGKGMSIIDGSCLSVGEIL